MNCALLNPQLESKLLSSPLEVRRAIYTHIIPLHIHASISPGRMRLSVCLQPNPGDNEHDGDDRRAGGAGYSELTWLSRLRSCWGPHWECEEFANGEEMEGAQKNSFEHFFKLLFVCKKMFLDFCDAVAETTTINCTGLDTEILLQTPGNLTHGLNSSWNPWEHMRPKIHKLSLTLRLALSYYKALEEDEALDSAPDHATDDSSSEARKTWASLWRAVGRLQQLHSLSIWLDHEDKCTWSVVKERLVLGSVLSILEARLESRFGVEMAPCIEIIFNIPKLHPRVVTPENHFTHDSAPPPFTIERRFRQRYHCEEWAPGQFSARYKADFPILHELGNMEEFGMTLKELEEYETGLWNRGDDVGIHLMQFSGVHENFDPI